MATVAAGGERPTPILARYRYERVFLVPPWPAIYLNDEDRRHTFEKARLDYERVSLAYQEAGYYPVILPLDAVNARADLLVAACSPGLR